MDLTTRTDDPQLALMALRRQRDELLAMLQRLLRVLSTAGTGGVAFHSVLEAARALIAQVRGEQT